MEKQNKKQIINQTIQDLAKLGLATGIFLGAIQGIKSLGGMISEHYRQEGIQMLVEKQNKERICKGFPKVNDNQHLIPIRGNKDGYRGFILLTDVDNDGIWDLADRCTWSATPGSFVEEQFVKEGYRPGTSISYQGSKHSFVKSDFFKPYE